MRKTAPIYYRDSERAIVVSGAHKGMDEASLDGENTFVLLDRGAADSI